MISTLLTFALVVQSKNLDHGAGSTSSAQMICDVIRDRTGTDLAFFPAGMLKQGSFGTLAEYLVSPSEEIVTITLTGAQLTAALDRSVSVYPRSNPGFLQMSGLEVNFRLSSGTPRIVSVDLESGTLTSTNSYTVTMPSSLAKGAFGYFTIWDTNLPLKATGLQLGEVIKSSKVIESSPRWRLQK